MRDPLLYRIPQPMRHLRRGPYCQRPLASLGRNRQHRPPFQGHGGEALMHDTLRHRHRRVPEGLGDLAARPPFAMDDIAVQLLVEHDAIAGLRGYGIHHRGQRIVVDLDACGHITGLGEGLCIDGGDGLAHIVHEVPGEDWMSGKFLFLGFGREIDTRAEIACGHD